MAVSSIAYTTAQFWLEGYPDGRFASAYPIFVEELAVVLLGVGPVS